MTDTKQLPNKSWVERIVNVFTNDPTNKKDLLSLLNDAVARKLIAPHSLGMIEGVLEVQELKVKDISIPRTQMITVDINNTLADVIKIVIKSGHSRFPVIGANKDEILGLILAKDLLQYSNPNSKNTTTIKDLLRPAIFIPESKRLDTLLQDFQLTHNHMAIVVNEYGGIIGLITIEDVIEQIVGNIEDEHDAEDSLLIHPREDSSYTVKAFTPIKDFNKYFNTHLLYKEIDTIGGFITRNLGRVPKRGETITIDKLQFKILKAEHRKIDLLKLKFIE